MIKTAEKRTAYKLFALRRDGTIGPLFINKRLVVPIGRWLAAEDHPTKGFAHRPGWHASHLPVAPHLTEKGRVWARVELRGAVEWKRPSKQGGTWFVARGMRVIELLTQQQINEIRGRPVCPISA